MKIVEEFCNPMNSFDSSDQFLLIYLFQTIDVQPNDGFGTLLPEESLPIDIIFSPKKAKVCLLLFMVYAYKLNFNFRC